MCLITNRIERVGQEREEKTNILGNIQIYIWGDQVYIRKLTTAVTRILGRVPGGRFKHGKRKGTKEKKTYLMAKKLDASEIHFLFLALPYLLVRGLSRQKIHGCRKLFSCSRVRNLERKSIFIPPQKNYRETTALTDEYQIYDVHLMNRNASHNN